VTMISFEQDAVFVALSVTATPKMLVPNGREAEKETVTEADGLLAGSRWVCMMVPFPVHTAFRASPSGSRTRAVISGVAAHSTVPDSSCRGCPTGVKAQLHLMNNVV
jgi:hypothetical protein